jgi:16S rRNA G527 N7-methylase RsmG
LRDHLLVRWLRRFCLNSEEVTGRSKDQTTNLPEASHFREVWTRMVKGLVRQLAYLAGARLTPPEELAAIGSGSGFRSG